MTTNPTVAVLFDEFVESHVSGGRPDVRDYLLRAGKADGELGVLIDRFLALAPVEAPDEETIVALNARLEFVTPLTEARRRLRLKVEDVVERLRDALDLQETSRGRLRVAYQELETDQLDPAGVSDAVWAALHKIFGVDPRRLAMPAAPMLAASHYLRQADFDAPPRLSALRSAAHKPDEVDALFRGTRLQ